MASDDRSRNCCVPSVAGAWGTLASFLMFNEMHTECHSESETGKRIILYTGGPILPKLKQTSKKKFGAVYSIRALFRKGAVELSKIRYFTWTVHSACGLRNKR